MASNSKRMVVICDYTKVAENLGTVWRNGVPIEVIPMAVEPISLKMRRMGGNPTLRMAISKAGPVVSGSLESELYLTLSRNAPAPPHLPSPRLGQPGARLGVEAARPGEGNGNAGAGGPLAELVVPALRCATGIASRHANHSAFDIRAFRPLRATAGPPPSSPVTTSQSYSSLVPSYPRTLVPS